MQEGKNQGECWKIPETELMSTEDFVEAAKRLTGGFQSLAPKPEEHWTRPVPDFPVKLRRAAPVEAIERSSAP